MMCDGDDCVQIESQIWTQHKKRIKFILPEILRNFGDGIWQNGQRIWIQRAKIMEMGYLLVFFGA